MILRTMTSLDQLQQAYDGSYYTILGTGGDLSEWITGYEGWLAEEGFGKPITWYETTGAAINLFAAHHRRGRIADDDLFALDLGALLFPLDGLDPTRLPLFKIAHLDRWFDDVIDNMRRAS